MGSNPTLSAISSAVVGSRDHQRRADRDRMVRIELSHRFHVSVAEAFAYITDMKNWPEYWPDFIRIESPPGQGWSRPGDKVTVEIRLLHRTRALNMELEEFQKNARVRYVSWQRGLPGVRHERRFDAAPEGCAYRMVVEYEPRPGLTGLFDRLFVKRSIERAMRRAVQNLERIFQKRKAS